MPDTKKTRHKRTPSNPRGAGAPVTVGGKPVQVYLDAASLVTAQALGDGNVSAGVRVALKMARENRSK